MKKTTIILLLVLQIMLLFVFQNLHTLFKEIEDTDITKIRDPHKFTEDIKKIRKVFSNLSIVFALMVIGTGFYLVFLFKKSRSKTEPPAIPPLQDYLLQLKGSETQLKDLVEKQQEHVIKKEELNKSIIKNIAAAVIFLNRSGRIETFNAAAERLFSCSYAHAANNLPAGILSAYPEIAAFLDSHYGFNASEEVTAGEKVFLVDLRPIENIGQLLMIKDITGEKKREEIERRNSNFIMLGEMAAFLAHEVRNSLGVIYGYTKTIEGEKEKTGKVNKEINFLTAMMESFLSFSRPLKADMHQSIDLADLLKKIAAETDIEMALESKPGQYVIESDPALIRSAFTNLLLNSREAGASRIDVEFNKGKDLEIYLKDNGKGIDEQIREKIWYPFFSTKEKGTGMGLAIIRKIINALNGEIQLFDSGSHGTAFKISFYN